MSKGRPTNYDVALCLRLALYCDLVDCLTIERWARTVIISSGADYRISDLTQASQLGDNDVYVKLSTVKGEATALGFWMYMTLIGRRLRQWRLDFHTALECADHRKFEFDEIGELLDEEGKQLRRSIRDLNHSPSDYVKENARSIFLRTLISRKYDSLIGEEILKDFDDDRHSPKHFCPECRCSRKTRVLIDQREEFDWVRFAKCPGCSTWFFPVKTTHTENPSLLLDSCYCGQTLGKLVFTKSLFGGKITGVKGVCCKCGNALKEPIVFYAEKNPQLFQQ